MEFINEVNGYLELYKEEIVQKLSDFVKIPSIRCKDSSKFPYGAECAKALDFCEELCRKKGFFIKNYDYRCLEVSLNAGQTGKRLVIASHADVVPPDKDTIYPPFSGEVVGDYVIGRGVVDDKGPLIATLYALAFFKENGIRLNHDIRLVFGSNEEDGMDDLEYYLKEAGQPDWGLAVDDDFPVVNGEKGLIRFAVSLNKSAALECIASYGDAQRLLPDGCRAVIDGETYVSEKSDDCENPIVSVISHHADALFETKEEGRKLLKIMEGRGGEFLEAAAPNERILDLQVRAYKVHMEDGAVKIYFDMRVPASADIGCVCRQLEEYGDRNHMKLDIFKKSPGFYLPESNEMVSLLTDLYNRVSGTDEKPYVMGACTYARLFERGCGFGAGNPHEIKPFPKGHGGAHGPDEAHNIGVLLHAVKMYILAIKAIDEYWEQAK